MFKYHKQHALNMSDGFKKFDYYYREIVQKEYWYTFYRDVLPKDKKRLLKLENIKKRKTKLFEDFRDETELFQKPTYEETIISEKIQNELNSANPKISKLEGEYMDNLKECKISCAEYMKNIKSDDENIRENAYKLFMRPCAKNKDILKDIVKIRNIIAANKGYKSWGNMRLRCSMAKTPDIVKTFLYDLSDKYDKIFNEEIKGFGLKEVHAWDLSRLTNKHSNFKISLDDALEGLMTKISELFDLKFIQVEEKTWNQHVATYEVYCGGMFYGKFYLDLLERNNKIKRAACYPLNIGNAKNRPVTALVCSFSKELNKQQHTTLYHEFGHLIHCMCSFTKYSFLQGLRTEWDFVEAPSQALENLVNERKYPGIFYKKQIMLSLTDILIHEGLNPDKAYMTAQKEIYKGRIEVDDEFPTRFSHLVCGYDSQYYSYIWSLHYSNILYKAILKDPIKYRDIVLKPGGSIDAVSIMNNIKQLFN